MKTFALALTAAVLSTAAFAQDASRAYRGSGQRAGGPAYLLNSSTGGAVTRTPRRKNALAYRGSGQRAGGPAYLLNDGGRR